MEYKMIVRRTLFTFDLIRKGQIKLRSVRFLSDAAMKQHNDLLLLTENDSVQFFFDQGTPVSHLSREQFSFVSSAAKYFGFINDKEQLPVWLWAGSLDIPEPSLAPAEDVCQGNAAVYC
ncbi:MAG: hypothetical protein DSY70_09105 [Desulfobulbus sp.]|nr:MAG: hypothetical protein DSY70_09105 [Desulfobulbus sp.]